MRQRYQPAVFNLDSVVVTDDTVHRYYRIGIYWNVPDIKDIRNWNVGRSYNSYLFRGPGVGEILDSTAREFHDYVLYHFPKTDYYYHIYLSGHDEADLWQECAAIKLSASLFPKCDTHTFIQAPGSVTAEDVEDDQGHKINISFSSVSNARNYLIGRATDPDGPFYFIKLLNPMVTNYVDSNAQNGIQYYYVVIANEQVSEYYWSSYSNVASACAIDNLTPDTVRNLQGVYLAGDCLIKITWDPPNPTNNPDIAGYWICPEYPDGMRYQLAHSSPVTRTVYYWPVSLPLPDSAGIAVAAMDYSGHISDWVLKYVQLRPSAALSNNPSATGLNNSSKLLYDANRGLLHIVYSDNNSVIYKNSNSGGISWTNEIDLGSGSYPALAKDLNNELHCAWVNLSPPLPPSDPTQPDTFYLPLPEYIWYLKYRYTQNGIWQGESAFVIDDFTKSPAIPMSMHFSAPAIVVTQDSVHIFMEKTVYYYYTPGWYWLLCYYAFPKSHPDMLSCSVIDSAFEYMPPPPLASPESLINISDPSCVADKYNGLHITYAVCSEIKYQSKINGTWSGAQTISPAGTYHHPSIGINFDELTVVWSGNLIPESGSEILCRRKFINSAIWGNVEHLDKGNNLSVFPICLNNQVLWSEQIDNTNYEIYYSRLSGYTWTEPENLSRTLSRSMFAQAAFYRGPRKGTLFYVFTDGNIAPYYLFTDKKDFLLDEIPVYAVNLGTEERSAITVERDGFLVYGEEPYMTVDYDSTRLVYSLTGLEPNGKYEIEWDWYHKFSGDSKQRLRTDNILNEHKWIPSGERVTIRKPVPQAVVQDGVMEITNEITAGDGCAVLSGFTIFDVAESGGGPQGEETMISGPFFLERIHPNPTKGALKIRFNSPDERSVSIKLYDVCGRLVQQECLKKSKTGVNELLITSPNYSAGVYFVQVDAGNCKKVEKTVWLR